MYLTSHYPELGTIRSELMGARGIKVEQGRKRRPATDTHTGRVLGAKRGAKTRKKKISLKDTLWRVLDASMKGKEHNERVEHGRTVDMTAPKKVVLKVSQTGRFWENVTFCEFLSHLGLGLYICP